MVNAAQAAYERITGDDQAYWGALDAAEAARSKPATSDAFGGDPAGDDFDFDDDAEMRARLPRLTAQLA
jgi:hypothetical protein